MGDVTGTFEIAYISAPFFAMAFFMFGYTVGKWRAWVEVRRILKGPSKP